MKNIGFSSHKASGKLGGGMGASILIFAVALILNAISKQPKAERGRSILIFVGVCVVAVIALAVIYSANNGESDAHNPSAASLERYEKFYGQAAREDMRKTLKKFNGSNPTESQINAGLKINDRDDYNSNRR